MKLTLKERLVLPNLYPLRDSLLSQLLVRNINEKIRIEKKEARKVDLKFDSKGVFRWNEKKTIVKNVTFTESEINFLKELVKKADNARVITPDMVDLCVKVKDYKEKE